MSRERAHIEADIKAAEERLKPNSPGYGFGTGFVTADEQAAQAELRMLKREMARMDDRRNELWLEETTARALTNRDLHRQAADFWFRRFFTTLGIANAAAFVAMASGFLQAADRASVASAVANPMTAFACGMLLAGIMPVMFWIAAANQTVAISNFLFKLKNWSPDTDGDHPDFGGHRLSNLGNFVAYAAAVGSVSAFIWGLMAAIGSVRGFAG